MPYRRVMLVVLGALALAAAPATAQEGTQNRGPELPGEGPPELPMPPDMNDNPGEGLSEGLMADEALQSLEIPAEDMARDAQLDALFEQLGRQDNQAWPVIQAQIWRVWRRSGSASMDLLLRRGMEKIEEKDYDTALVFLDDLVRLAPEFAEGWNQRATAHFLKGDYGRSMRDIEVVLTLEPRHFGALSGLGIILDRTGNAKGAVEAYRRALALHPNLEGAQRGVDRLKEEVDGQEL